MNYIFVTLKKFFKKNNNINQPSLKDIHNSSIWINKNIFLGKIKYRK